MNQDGGNEMSRSPVERGAAPGDEARRRRLRFAVGVGSLAAASVAVAAVALGATADDPARQGRDALSGDQPAGGSQAAGGTGRCARSYSPAAVAKHADFAFDGTVSMVGTYDAEEDALPYVPVTFTVNEWYAGGSGDTVEIDMLVPSADGAPIRVKPRLRLLVSGASLSGGSSLDDAVGWECGFTRYYDEVTADDWREVLD